VIKCHQTEREVNSINDYLDILSTLTSRLAEPPVIDYLNKTWSYNNVNHDSSDNESDDDDNEDEKLFCGYSDDELEAMILYFILLRNNIIKVYFSWTGFKIMFGAFK